MTTLADGRLVFVANQRGWTDPRIEDSTIAIVTTRDLLRWSAPFELTTPYGAGHSVRLVQPHDNGSDASEDLHLWHSGSLYNPEGLNHFLRYRYGRIAINE